MAVVNLQNKALEGNDNPRLMASVTGIDWENIVAKELKYHKSCYSNLTRERRTKTSENILGDDLIEFI